MSLLRKLLIQNSGTRKIPNNTIEYTTTDGNPISLFQIGNRSIKSNIYSNGKGIITIYGDSITGLGSSSYNSFNITTTRNPLPLGGGSSRTAPPSIGSDIFYGVQSYTIYVPEASVESYKTAEGWSEFADNICPIT